MSMLQAVNPANGEKRQSYQTIDSQALEHMLDASAEAFATYREMPLSERARILREASAILEANKQSYATLMAQEMGKPLAAGIDEIEKCAWVCRYYADHAAEFLEPTSVNTEYSKSYVCYQPLGTLLAVMPWNYPFWQVFRFAAPNLMAGNTIVLKHAEICMGSGLAIAELLLAAGLPETVFQTLLITSDSVEQVIKHRAVQGITLTGSGRAGSAIGQLAGKYLKKVVLELGGNDPYVILDDADLDLAAEICVNSRMKNSGQVCIAAKRLIVLDSICDAFEAKVLERLKSVSMGDPLAPETNFGPIARADLRDDVHRQVQQAIADGAELVMGGTLPDGPGFYYPPTVIKNVKPNNIAFKEEIFGPVITIIPARDVDEAITLANQTDYGLAGAVFSKDIAKAETIARDKIQAGSVAVNRFVSSDPRLPFGGIKASGYGRELGIEAMREFVNIKTITVT